MDHTAPPDTDVARIIALLNQKGGVGKTTTTVNLGAALAKLGKRVLLIDLDPQAHLTLHLGIDEDRITQTVYDLFIDPDCTAEQGLINARENLDVILSEVDLAGAEPELASMPDRQRILRRKVQPVLHRYDVVLLDCPPSLGVLTLNALAMADEVFVPMQAHFLALQGVGKLLETVGLVCQSVNPDLRVTGIILCMHEGQTTLAREVVADLDAFFEQSRDQELPWRDCRVLRPAIRRNIKLAEAPSFGNTIFDYAPWCPGALDYRKLAERLIRRWDHAASNDAHTGTESADAATAEPPAPRAAQIVEPKDDRSTTISTQPDVGATPPQDAPPESHPQSTDEPAVEGRNLNRDALESRAVPIITSSGGFVEDDTEPRAEEVGDDTDPR